MEALRKRVREKYSLGDDVTSSKQNTDHVDVYPIPDEEEPIDLQQVQPADTSNAVPWHHNLFNMEAFEDVSSVGTYTNPYTGEVSEHFEQNLPVPDTRRRQISQRELKNTNPQLIRLQGGVDYNKPRIHKNNQLKPLEATGLPTFDGVYDAKIRNKHQQSNSLQLFNNRDGMSLPRYIMSGQQPVNKVGYNDDKRFIPPVTNSNNRSLNIQWKLPGSHVKNPIDTTTEPTHYRQQSQRNPSPFSGFSLVQKPSVGGQVQQSLQNTYQNIQQPPDRTEHQPITERINTAELKTSNAVNPFRRQPVSSLYVHSPQVPIVAPSQNISVGQLPLHQASNPEYDGASSRTAVIEQRRTPVTPIPTVGDADAIDDVQLPGEVNLRTPL